MQLKRTVLDFVGQHLFIDLDIHKTFWTVSIVMEHTVFKTFRQAGAPPRG